MRIETQSIHNVLVQFFSDQTEDFNLGTDARATIEKDTSVNAEASALFATVSIPL